MSQFEQQEVVKFCQKLGKSASEMFQMKKQAYGEESLGCSAVFKWHRRFALGRDSLEDDKPAKNGQNCTQDPRSYVGVCQLLPNGR
jgi:hypothetical protein